MLMMKNNTSMCISDPRLCNIEKFQDLEKYLSKKNVKNIFLVIFENDPIHCIENKPRLAPMISAYSKFYIIDNYSEYDNIILRVYHPQITNISE